MIGWFVWEKKLQPFYNWFKSGTFQSNFYTCFRCEHSRPLPDIKQKGITNSNLLRVFLKVYVRLKTTQYKVFFNLWRFVGKNGNSKVFNDSANTGTYQKMSNFYFRHNLFHRSTPDRDVEQQKNTLCSLQNSRNIMWFRPIRLVNIWVSDHEQLTGMEMQNFTTFIL